MLGLLPQSSNYTFLACVVDVEREMLAVYKPRRGERALWDFPPGTLAAREVAAYEVSRAGGFDLVPPTVLRAEAPLGEGSLQMFVEHDPARHYFVLVEERAADLEVFAAFDVVVNNADRKAGHVLEGTDGRLWAIDHGVTFHALPKLRTVIWEFAEQQVTRGVCDQLQLLSDALEQPGRLRDRLAELLSDDEVRALKARTRALMTIGRYPQPSGERPYPWPLV